VRQFEAIQWMRLRHLVVAFFGVQLGSMEKSERGPFSLAYRIK
jgi:hypothetical protein